MNPSQLSPGDPGCPQASWPTVEQAHRLDRRAKHIQALNPGWSYVQALKLAVSELSQPAPRATAAPAPARPAAAEAAALEALRAMDALAQARARAAAIPAPPKPPLGPMALQRANDADRRAEPPDLQRTRDLLAARARR